MGVDIHMSIVKNEEVIAKDIYHGRNSEWFSNLQDNGWDTCYDYLPIVYGISSKAPKSLKDEYTKDNAHYGFYHILVKHFKEWFEQYRPDLDAGWVTTYDKWKLEKKGEIPAEIYHYLNSGMILADYHFVEVENSYDCSRWLYTYLVDNNIDDNADITYCFDS